LVNGRNRFEQLLRRVIVGEYFNWSNHCHVWQSRRPGCTTVKFESLIANPGESVQQSLPALGIELAKQEEQIRPSKFCTRMTEVLSRRHERPMAP